MTNNAHLYSNKDNNILKAHIVPSRGTSSLIIYTLYISIIYRLIIKPSEVGK